MKKYFWTGLFCLIFCMGFMIPVQKSIPDPAAPGANGRLSSLEIEIWPEYDQPSVLVIYHLTLDSGMTFPASLVLKIPAAAGRPNSVAYIDSSDGNLYNLAYDYETREAWGVVSFTTSAREIQMEYYDPSMSIQGEDHHFEFIWPGDYAVDALSFHVQQPISATDLVLQPTLGNPQTASNGLTTYYGLVGSFQQGESFHLKLDYKKSNPQLSIAQLQVQPSSPLDESSAGRMTLNRLLPMLIGILFLVVIGLAGWWFGLHPQLQVRSDSRKRHGEKGENQRTVRGGSVPPESSAHCPQCGQPVRPEDLFCRSCGTRLKE